MVESCFWKQYRTHCRKVLGGFTDHDGWSDRMVSVIIDNQYFMLCYMYEITEYMHKLVCPLKDLCPLGVLDISFRELEKLWLLLLEGDFFCYKYGLLKCMHHIAKPF